MSTFRLQSAPMIFWDNINPDQWQALTDSEQDILVEAAKIILQKGKFKNSLANNNIYLNRPFIEDI